MGYVSDNTTPEKNWVICQDLYLYRIIVDPNFASDLTLQTLVRDVIPDVEEWQFSGRRRYARARYATPINPLAHPYGYAQNSRRARPFDAKVVFAFRTTLGRDAAAARLTSNRFSYTFENEPA